MKLYKLPKNTKFRLEEEDDLVFTLEKIDGMYSICRDSDGEIFNINASAEVIPLECLE